MGPWAQSFFLGGWGGGRGVEGCLCKEGLGLRPWSLAEVGGLRV